MAVKEDIQVNFPKEGGSSGFTYTFENCQGNKNVLFEYEDSSVEEWLHKTVDDNRLIIKADDNLQGVDVRNANILIKLNNRTCSKFLVTQEKGLDCQCETAFVPTETQTNIPSAGGDDVTLGTYTYSADCITLQANGSSSEGWITNVRVSDGTIIGNVAENSNSGSRGPARITVSGQMKSDSSWCTPYIEVSQNGTGCECNPTTFRITTPSPIPIEATGDTLYFEYISDENCISVTNPSVSYSEGSGWITNLELAANKTVTGTVLSNESYSPRSATITLSATVNGSTTPCERQITVEQKEKVDQCDCDFIQDVQITHNIPSDGGDENFQLGTMKISQGMQCTVTFTSETTSLYVKTAATETENILSIVLAQKGPINEDPDEDTPSKTYHINAFVNNKPCNQYNVVQEGTILCDCAHIKIDEKDVRTKLPPIEFDNIVLLTADTKGCGTLEFSCESRMFKDNVPQVDQIENIYIVKANLNAPSPTDVLPIYGVVAYTYILNGQDDDGSCKGEITFEQTDKYCGCEFDFDVVTKGYVGRSKYLIEPYFYDEKPYITQTDRNDNWYTIPPKFYNYCIEGQIFWNSWKYCDLQEKNVIAKLYRNDYRLIDTCRSFSVTVKDDCDWITIGNQDTTDGDATLQFAWIGDNDGEEDREATLIIQRNTTDEGDCEPVEIVVKQRHDITTCDELMEAIGDYYTFFTPPTSVSSRYDNTDITNIFVPYGKLILDVDEDLLETPQIYCDGYYNNANFLGAKIRLKSSISRDETLNTNIVIKIQLSNGEVCDIYSFNIEWQKESSPVTRPCNCDNLKLTQYPYIQIPYNFGCDCDYCSTFGYDNSTESCGTISGVTCDENGAPMEYDWFKITEYFEGPCGRYGGSTDYSCKIRLLYQPSEDKIGYFKPFLVKNGEIVFPPEEGCGNNGLVSVEYNLGCNYARCINDYGNLVYKILNLDHIETELTAYTNDVGRNFHIGYIDIGFNDNCYTTNGIECCVKGFIDSTHKKTVENIDGYFDNLKWEWDENVPNRLQYSFDFVNAPNQEISDEGIPLVINVYIADREQIEGHIRINLKYYKTN